MIWTRVVLVVGVRKRNLVGLLVGDSRTGGCCSAILFASVHIHVCMCVYTFMYHVVEVWCVSRCRIFEKLHNQLC